MVVDCEMRIQSRNSFISDKVAGWRALRIAQVVEIDPASQTVKVPGSSEVPVKQSIVRFIDAPQGLLPPKE